MIRSFFVFLMLLVTVGCLQTRAELAEEANGQTQEKTTVAQQQEAQNEHRSVAKEPDKAPPAAYRFEEIDEQMRTLNGRVDTLETQVAQVNTTKTADKDSVDKEKQSIDQRFLAYEEALKKMEVQIAALNVDVARLTTPPPEPTVAMVGKGKSAYDQGEEQFTAKKWKEAVAHYQKYRETNPKGKSYPDATYKIAVCLQELGMKEDAKVFLEEVTTKFPNSKEAKKAAYRLKTIK